MRPFALEVIYMASQYTFTSSKVCPICEQNTRVIKIKSKIVVESTDEDFCNHYKEGFNPYFYQIWVCEHCGFAADEKHFLSSIPMKIKEKIRKKILVDQKIHFEFMEERHMPEAVASYRLAELFAEMRNAPLQQQAGILLRIAWLYRFSEERDKEREYMQKAVDMYIRSQKTELYPQGNVTEFDVLYLIAAIYYRMMDKENCRKYLKLLLDNNNLRHLNSRVYELSHKMWEYVREPEEAEKNKLQGTAAKARKSDKGERKSRFRF